MVVIKAVLAREIQEGVGHHQTTNLGVWNYNSGGEFRRHRHQLGSLDHTNLDLAFHHTATPQRNLDDLELDLLD